MMKVGAGWQSYLLNSYSTLCPEKKLIIFGTNHHDNPSAKYEKMSADVIETSKLQKYI